MDIMREQADERLAKNHHRQEYNYEDELELVKKLSLEEANKAGIRLQEETPTDSDSVKQYEEDELLALFLQREERNRVRRVHPNSIKVLPLLEYKLLTEQFGVEQEPIEDLIEDTEYNYVEPFELEPSENQKEEHPILYDDAQKKEDMEIGYVEKRMVEKRVNAAPVAMHHKLYATRNKGKVLVYGNNRVRPTPKSYSFPVKDYQYEYGFVTKVLGGCRFNIFCYASGKTKLCRMVGKLKYSHVILSKGDVVLYKIRPYQEKKGDIVYRYSDKDYETLLEIGELIERDPKKMFPEDVWQKICSYLDSESLENLQIVYSSKIDNKSFI